MRLIILKILFLSCAVCTFHHATAQDPFRITSLSSPQESSAGYEKGVSAPFCAAADGIIITAGGANFPEKPVSEGGQKRFYNDIFTVTQDGVWTKAGELPEPSAYGCTFSMKGEIILAGGCNSEGAVDKVLSIIHKGRKIKIRRYADLPATIEQAGSASLGNEMYIIGGLVNGKPSADIYKGVFKGRKTSWTKAFSLPEAMVQPVACLINKTLYVWGGFNPSTGKVLGNGYALNTATGEWRRIADVPENGTFTGASLAAENGKAVIIGGVDKEIFTRGLKATGKDKEDYLTMEPAGYNFNRNIWIFDPVSESWESAGKSEDTALAGAGITMMDGGIYIIGGEIKPGVRTPESWKLNIIYYDK